MAVTEVQRPGVEYAMVRLVDPNQTLRVVAAAARSSAPPAPLLRVCQIAIGPDGDTPSAQVIRTGVPLATIYPERPSHARLAIAPIITEAGRVGVAILGTVHRPGAPPLEAAERFAAKCAAVIEASLSLQRVCQHEVSR